jgi:hypothetical protein
MGWEEDVMDVSALDMAGALVIGDFILITSSNVQQKENIHSQSPETRDSELRISTPKFGITNLDSKVRNYEFRFSQHLYQRYTRTTREKVPLVLKLTESKFVIRNIGVVNPNLASASLESGDRLCYVLLLVHNTAGLLHLVYML